MCRGNRIESFLSIATHCAVFCHRLNWICFSTFYKVISAAVFAIAVANVQSLFFYCLEEVKENIRCSDFRTYRSGLIWAENIGQLHFFLNYNQLWTKILGFFSPLLQVLSLVFIQSFFFHPCGLHQLYFSVFSRAFELSFSKSMRHTFSSEKELIDMVA